MSSLPANALTAKSAACAALAFLACAALPIAAPGAAYAQDKPATRSSGSVPLPEKAPGMDSQAETQTTTETPAPAENTATPSPSDAAAGNTGETQPSGSAPVQLPAGPDDDSSVVRQNYGAWSMICDQPPGASYDQCALMQNVIADDRPEIGLSVAVLKTADRQSKLLRILAPLGVLLPEGMGLFVDGVNIGKAYFSRCYFDGCYVEVEIDDDLMKIFRAGKEAVFTLNFSVDQETIGIPVALDGLGAGYDALP